jgi:hypothetical protein
MNFAPAAERHAIVRRFSVYAQSKVDGTTKTITNDMIVNLKLDDNQFDETQASFLPHPLQP